MLAEPLQTLAREIKDAKLLEHPGNQRIVRSAGMTTIKAKLVTELAGDKCVTLKVSRPSVTHAGWAAC